MELREQIISKGAKTEMKFTDFWVQSYQIPNSICYSPSYQVLHTYPHAGGCLPKLPFPLPVKLKRKQQRQQHRAVCRQTLYARVTFTVLSKPVHILQAVVWSLRNTLLVLCSSSSHHGIAQWSSDVCIDSKYADLVHVRQFCHNQHKNCYRIEEKHRLLVVSQVRCNQIPGRTHLRIYATQYDNINLVSKIQ